ncbi:MAG: bifunctional methylenetetrahydrofolate dehydrogenase/methenyltetrahydrofolate cyclohydrolase [Thaumarchaeota archaeon]|nr:bifunctional methylenetetrahydrofolate dehydrogenase/methenyltetrahydrofolate cyclohydrolase [Nitrososphaerota archaeon]
MVKILDGKERSKEVRSRLSKEVAELRDCGVVPTIALIHIGDLGGAAGYVKRKAEACRSIGIEAKVLSLPEQTDFNTLKSVIQSLNGDQRVHGILLQLPIPQNIDEQEALDLISAEKDVDGSSSSSLGLLLAGKEGFVSAGALAALDLAKLAGFDFKGSTVHILGDSVILGRPFAAIALNLGAEVKLNPKDVTTVPKDLCDADLLLVDVAKPKLIKSEHIKQGAVIIDAGNNYLDGKIVGDVDFEDACKKASAITPVPGGLGPMLITMLMSNLIKAAKRLRSKL